MQGMQRGAARASFIVATLATLVLGFGCSDDSGTGTDSGGKTDGGVADGAGGDGAAGAQVQIPGLSDKVEAYYDEHGILHLHGKTDGDVLAALGYFHAANRFFTMDFYRSLVRGKLSELTLAGPQGALDADIAMRHLMTTRDGTPLEEDALTKVNKETLTLIERYTAGINAWLADLDAKRNGAVLPEEYQFLLLAPGRKIPAWEPADTMAVALFLINELGNSIDEELYNGEMAAKLAPDLAADLLMEKPIFSSFTTTASGVKTISLPGRPDLSLAHLKPAARALARARRYLAPAMRYFSGGASNNWVLAPSRTTNKKALLANDPHLPLLNPALVMPVEIDSKTDANGTLHVAGPSLPGVPVVIGHNETLATGITTSFYDLNDLYLEKLSADGKKVIFKGKEVPIVEKQVTFQSAAGGPQTRTLKWVPHHGPLLSEDTTAKTAVSVRWAAHDGISDLEGLLGLMRASRVADAPAALAKLTAFNQNFVVADVDGNIGWYPYARVPSRPWATTNMHPGLPVPGDGTAEWDTFIAMSELPQATNPPNGFIATANNGHTDATADGDSTNDGNIATHAFQERGKSNGARMARIVELIEAGKSAHTVGTMLEIQADVFSLIGELVTPELLKSVSGKTLDAAGTEVVKALSSWAYDCPSGLASSDPKGAKDGDATRVSESNGCAAFHATLFFLVQAALGDEAKKAEIVLPHRLRLNMILTALAEPTVIKSNFWDDVSTTAVTETRDDIIKKAIEAAGAELTKIDASSTEWIWGRIHTVFLRSVYDALGVASYNDGPYANDGALGTVDVATPHGFRSEDVSSAEIDLSYRRGAVYRLVTEIGSDGPKMKFQMPGGTDMIRDSKRFNQLLPKYLKNEPIDFPFGAGAVKSKVDRIELVPAS